MRSVLSVGLVVAVAAGWGGCGDDTAADAAPPIDASDAAEIDAADASVDAAADASADAAADASADAAADASADAAADASADAAADAAIDAGAADASADAAETADAAADAAVDGSPDAALPPTGLVLTFAGDAGGEVRVQFGAWPDFQYAVCNADCVVPIAPGTPVYLAGVTPSTFSGFSGGCSSTGTYCSLTMAESAAVTATFTKDPAEQWTKLFVPGGTAYSADYDPSGNLIVGTSGGLYKLSGDGDEIWSIPSLHFGVTDPDGNIITSSNGNLIKLDTDGNQLWSSPLGSSTGGCMNYDGLGHGWDIGPNGDIVMQRGRTLQAWTTDGDLHWSINDVGVNSRCRVAVDSTGLIYTATESALDPDTTDLLRFTADGVPLSPLADFSGGSLDLVVDGTDRRVTTTSLNIHVQVSRQGVFYDEVNAIYAAYETWTTVAADATGHVTLAYFLNEMNQPYEGFAARHYSPAGVLEWNLVKATIQENYSPYGVWGFRLSRVAADASGNVAIVGKYGAVSGPYAVVKVFHF